MFSRLFVVDVVVWLACRRRPREVPELLTRRYSTRRLNRTRLGGGPGRRSPPRLTTSSGLSTRSRSQLQVRDDLVDFVLCASELLHPRSLCWPAFDFSHVYLSSALSHTAAPIPAFRSRQVGHSRCFAFCTSAWSLALKMDPTGVEGAPGLRASQHGRVLQP